MPEPRRVVISSDADAWKLLGELVSDTGRAKFSDDIALELSGWPTFESESKRGDAEIGTSTMDGFLAIQEAINRTYNQYERGRRDLRAFTDEERRKLELYVQVGSGSSSFSAALQKVALEIGKRVGKKMQPKHVLIAILVVGLTWGGTEVWKHSISEAAKVRLSDAHTAEQRTMLEAFTELSAEETKRLQLFEEALNLVPDARVAERESEGAKQEFLRKLPPGFGVEIEGIVIPAQVLEELVKTERQATEEVTVKRIYLIDAIKSGDDDGFDFSVRLKDYQTGIMISADFGELLTNTKQRALVKSAFFDKRPLELTLKARSRRGEIVSGQITGAKTVPKAKLPKPIVAASNL